MTAVTATLSLTSSIKLLSHRRFTPRVLEASSDHELPPTLHSVRPKFNFRRSRWLKGEPFIKIFCFDVDSSYRPMWITFQADGKTGDYRHSVMAILSMKSKHRTPERHVYKMGTVPAASPLFSQYFSYLIISVFFSTRVSQIQMCSPPSLTKHSMLSSIPKVNIPTQGFSRFTAYMIQIPRESVSYTHTL